ncbi:MAG TPA: amidase family protein, partial [Pyrinomonadaceae bacterium]|nr:amidase family protein [Pyrinomonadaceae bacterium]
LRGRGVAIYLDQESAPVTEETEQTVKAVAAALGQAGLTLIEERPPGLQRAIDLWAQLYSRAALVQLRNFYEGQEEEAGPLVGSMLAPGAADSFSGSDAGAAVRVERDSLRAELFRWMESIPLIIAPVGAVPAFERGARRVEVRGKSVSVFRAFGYARAANVLGFPSVAVPAGKSREGLPIGIQIIGRPFEEETLLAAASIIEEVFGGWIPPPNLAG